MQILFIHGGPGRNSNAESKILGDLMPVKTIFWNEPSALRGAFNQESAYLDWYNSMKESINDETVIIAHSFATLPVVRAALEVPDKVKKLVLITPANNLLGVDGNIFEEVGKALNNIKIQKADNSKFNLDTFLKVAEYTELENHYWTNKDAMERYWQLNNEAQWKFDPHSFIAVRTGYNEKIPKRIETPVLAIFGENDVIVRQESEEPLLNKFSINHKVVIMKNTSHFPHIENPDEFVDILKSFIF